VGDNPWNGTRETRGPSESKNSKCRCTTLRKVRIQPPSSASAVVMCGGSPMKSARVWWAGECEGSGKVFFHRSMGDFWTQNSTLAKRWVRVRWIHDLETTQQTLSVVGSSCRWSMMRSRTSGGKEGDIVVCARGHWFRRRDAGFRFRSRIAGARAALFLRCHSRNVRNFVLPAITLQPSHIFRSACEIDCRDRLYPHWLRVWLL
jgi:hypothetical protein